jgi:alcohol dehydrogenase
MPEPGESQVLIKIRASGMCYTDVHQTHGGGLPGDFPRTLGHEPAGEIVAVGPGVTVRKVGDRVGVPWVQHTCGRCEWCARGKSIFCEKSISTGVQMSGGHAEYMVAYADATMLLPDRLVQCLVILFNNMWFPVSYRDDRSTESKFGVHRSAAAGIRTYGESWHR